MRNKQINRSHLNRGRTTTGKCALVVLALASTLAAPRIDVTINDASPDATIAVRFLGTEARADDRDNARKMQEFAREQEREERRRQRQAAEDAKRLEREAQENARRAAKAQRDSEQRAGGVGTGWTDSAPAKSPAVSVGSGTSSAKDNAIARDDNGRVRGSAASSTSDGDKKGGTSKSPESARVVQPDPGPPPTVEKWLKQLVSPKAEEPTSDADAPGEGKKQKDTNSGKAAKPLIEQPSSKSPISPDPKKADVTAIPAGTAAIRGKSKGTAHIEPIAFPKLPRPEVLAINASSQALSRAKALGFKTTTATTLASLDFEVMRLLPPEGMTADSAQELLTLEVPDGTFAANKKYRIYRTASGTESPPRGSPAASALTDEGALCGVDRCFGRDVIGWKPELRSCVSGMKIGIIDTSVDVTHPTFKRKKIEIGHFRRAGKPGPNWHGTGVAALLAGDSRSGTPGLIPDATFYVADIFHSDEDSEPASDTLSMLRAFDWMEAKGVKIINMSLSGPPDDLIQKAIAKLSAKGILLVAAAGNEGPRAGPSYPAAYDQVIAVTAVNKNLQNYRYANRGSYIDIAAPGVAIWTALPGSQQGYHSGTSFATPYVTASLAALYPRIAGQKADDALRSLQYRDLGEPGDDPVYGKGLLVAPSSCSGSQVASKPAAPPQSQQDATGLGFFETSVAIPPAAPAEQLPWLSLQGSE